MGLFKRKPKNDNAPSFSDPVVTYNITQSLSGKLTVSPTPSSYQPYSITLTKQKGHRDAIKVAVHRSSSSADSSSQTPLSSGGGGDVGHCLIHVVRGRFLDCRLGDGTEVRIKRDGRRSSASYGLETVGGGQRHRGHRGYRWAHDDEALGSADGRLKLEDADGGVVARFGGADAGVSEFGVLEIYDARAAGDQVLCGLLVMTGVCVYAREERSRERRRKVNDAVGNISNWGGLLALGA